MAIADHRIPGQRATVDQSPWSPDCIFWVEFAHSPQTSLVWL
jgi:hypothetical protein